MPELASDWWLSWLLRSRTQLLEHRALLDRLNYFPVADSDTGSNLYSTLSQALDRVGALDEPSLTLTASWALRQARGNSGTLLAITLGALARVLEEPASGPLTPQLLGSAWQEAASQARSALAEPAEGTILTLLDALASCPVSKDWETYLPALLARGQEALQATASAPQAQQGRADAGALGLFLFLPALHQQILGRQAEKSYLDFYRDLPPVQLQASRPAGPREAAEEQVEVMATLTLGVLEAVLLKEALGPLGDSLSLAQVEAGEESLWALHLHTSNPQQVLDLIQQADSRAQVRSEKIQLGQDHAR